MREEIFRSVGVMTKFDDDILGETKDTVYAFADAMIAHCRPSAKPTSAPRRSTA